MHIKKIEIDGFKSYAQKQTIDNFDLQFNAITGLNGSGKSNILDAICFVLGISDLKCIRAENLNALVYKSGQAGITKCSVTIVFDNRDKKIRPLGFDEYEEIIVRRQHVVNGRSSYSINGSAITNNKVFDFFRSVGLNVNNPHFLIMQGRITKVLNMKPQEILGMVEEAAGTKMYDAKRAQAMTVIEKKDTKVHEIEHLLKNEIQPKVDRLNEEKKQFVTFQKFNRDIDILKRQLDAYDYWSYLEEEKVLKSSAAETDQAMAAKAEEIEKLKADQAEIADRIAHFEAKRTAKYSAEQKGFQDEVAKVKEDRVQAEADRDAVSSQLTETQSEIDRINEELVKDKNNYDETKKKLAESEKNHGGEEEMGKKAEDTIASSKAKLEALAKGLSTDDDGQAITLEAQITNAKSALTEISTKVKTAEMKRKKMEPELAQKKKQHDQMCRQSSSDTKELDNCEKEVKKQEAVLKDINYDQCRYEELINKLPAVKQEHMRAENDLNRFYMHFSFLQFKYDKRGLWDGFDETAEIHGTVASLFKLRDMKYAAALDVLCISQIYSVVFSHQQTAAMFVDKGLLTQRRTIMPMDKISAPSHEGLQKRIDLAMQICEERGKVCHLALDLIEFDPFYQKIMEYIFKGVLVVEDPRLASELSFNPAIKLRVVTTDGDDVRPGGTLSGGTHRNQEAPLLERIKGFHDVYMKWSRLNKERNLIEEELEEMAGNRRAYTDARHALDRLRGRWETLRENLKNSPVQILREEIASMEQEIPKFSTIIEEGQAEAKALAKKIKDLEDKKKNEKDYYEKEKKKYEKELKDAQQTLKNIRARFDNARDTLERLRKELEKNADAIKRQNAEIETLTKRKEELSAELGQKERIVQAAFEVENAKQADLDRFMAELKQNDQQIKKARQQEDKIKKTVRDGENELSGLERKQKKYWDDAQECRRAAAALKKNNKVLGEIENSLGKEGDYSFKGFKKDEAKGRLEKLQKERDEMGKTLNPQAHAVLDNAQAQISDLYKKTDQVKRDKQTLLQTIETLDEKKKKEILKAYEQVNKDFGNIFSTLLVGAGAKLEPPKGKTVLEGLEVKVCFNGQYKDSLNELSGGQRSLVALSLVLAMLKFKPAPIYILDEVDSALDSSHTQNIGMMIKNYFTTSQFIIVSLKEGMFCNASVIYRTKFVDGTSKVTRTLGIQDEADEHKKKKKQQNNENA